MCVRELICILFYLITLETNKRLEEELEVYGSGLKTSVQLTSYTFEVRDTIYENQIEFHYMNVIFSIEGMRFLC